MFMTSMNPRISSWQGKRVWIVGASTGIGAALIKPMINQGARLAVTARREPALFSAFTKATGLSVEQTRSGGHQLICADVTEVGELQAAHDTLLKQWGAIDLIIWVAGTYAPMQADNFELTRALAVVNTNLSGVLNGLAVVLPTLLKQGKGGIAIVSSVAGYSGLPKALIYGPTKAALINLCESLYLDLHPRGIGVTLINPGFVDTPLTAGNNFKMPALISADTAAEAILSGLARGDYEIHFPHRFTRWLKFLRILPYWLYMPLIGRATREDGAAQAQVQRD
jgi:short-subunit dehydrogenase